MDSKGSSQDARIKLRVNNFFFIMAFLGFLALVFQLLTRISPFFTCLGYRYLQTAVNTILRNQ